MRDSLMIVLLVLILFNTWYRHAGSFYDTLKPSCLVNSIYKFFWNFNGLDKIP